MTAVVGVVGGHGGAGASTLAAALASTCGGGVLLDLDPLGGGIDVALGVEAVPGVRWSGLYSDGGRFDPAELAAALPVWAGTPVLACDGEPPPPRAVGPVLDACAALGPVVLDLGRAAAPGRSVALDRCDVVVVLAGRDVRTVSAAAAVRRGLPAAVCRTVVPARGRVRPARVAEVVRAPLVGVWAVERAAARAAASGLPAGRWRRSTRALCAAVLESAA